MNIIRVTLFLVLIALHGVSWATNYWVLGSYARTASAVDAAEQLAPLTGVTIQVFDFEHNGGLFHRLVINESVLSQSMSSSLQARGITPWLMTAIESELRSLSDIQTGLKGQSTVIAGNESVWYQLIVERFSSVEEALASERKLAEVFLRVEGKSQLQNGKINHLVVVGPVSASDLAMTEKSLAALGYNVPERVRVEKPIGGQDAALLADVSFAEAAGSSARARSAPEVEVAERVPADDEFNLARLPKKKHHFINP